MHNESDGPPSTWREPPLCEIAETRSGGTPDRQRPEYYGGAIPWVKSGELRDNIIRTTEERLSEDGLHNSNAKVFPAGTPLVALYGATTGKVALLGIEAATNQAVAAILANDRLAVPEFLVYALMY